MCRDPLDLIVEDDVLVAPVIDERDPVVGDAPIITLMDLGDLTRCQMKDNFAPVFELVMDEGAEASIDFSVGVNQ